IDDGDIPSIQNVRSKIIANIKYHEELTQKLNDVVVVDDNEQGIVANELDECSILNMDAKEVLQLLDDSMLQKSEAKQPQGPSRVQILEEEKIAHEIANLKLDMDVKRAKLESLEKNNEAFTKGVKLPQLSLPSFSGKVTEWFTFWDSFESTIHKNADLADVDKFKYLLSCLHDDARDTLTGFQITGAKYAAAIALLKRRYDDKEFILHNHYEALSTLRKCKNTTHHLRHTSNTIENHLRSLESLGER
ncbi:MAG: DUF1759 domain-containing protein, partial [Nitrosopumilus sp.]|nr:DUF1759 domain-containing protein [Nitrosopumilus sp.]